MLNFTLSNYLNGSIVNNIILILVKKYHHFLRTQVHLNQIGGSLPFDTWNGGFNINQDNNIILSPNFSKIIEISKNASLRLNCSNIFLTENDFKDNYHEVLLKSLDNGSTAIQITSLKGMEYLKNNYNFTKYILSENAVCLQPYTPDVINLLLQNTEFDLIQIPNIYREDFEFLSKIEDPSRIEICINPICPIYCQNYFACIYQENEAQINFSNYSNFQNCIKTFEYSNNKNTLAISTLKEKYSSIGINNFYFCSCPVNQIDQYFKFLLAF